MKRLALLFAPLFFLLTGCQKTEDPLDAQPKTISDVLTETASFSLFRAALQQAGLNDALKAPDLTVFAPTDDAFKARGFATPASFQAVPIETLRTMLRYHVLTGVVTTQTPELTAAANLPVETANKSVLFLTNGASGLFVNGNRVTRSDQMVANGVIHTIGSVLSPSTGDAITVLKGRSDMTLLVAAITRASVARPELLTILNGTSTNAAYRNLTFFAPTDAAFNAAGYRNTADVAIAPPQTLASQLSYHIVPTLLFSNQLQAGQLTTLNTTTNNRLTIALPASGPTVKGNSNAAAVPLKDANVVSRNAVIHVIDQILLP